MTDLTEKTLATERKYTGKIISVDLLDIELPDGRKAKREVIRHGNAVAILARRPDGKFVFVKQYRKAAEEALIEVIAGGLEPGARRPRRPATRLQASSSSRPSSARQDTAKSASTSTSRSFQKRRILRTRTRTKTSILSCSLRKR